MVASQQFATEATYVRSYIPTYVHACMHNSHVDLCMEIAFVQEVGMHVCEMKPEFIITNQTSSTAFQFLYMTLDIDITDGRGMK